MPIETRTAAQKCQQPEKNAWDIEKAIAQAGMADGLSHFLAENQLMQPHIEPIRN